MKTYIWKTNNAMSLEVCESNQKYKTCYWKYVEAAENIYTNKNTIKTHTYIHNHTKTHTSFFSGKEEEPLQLKKEDYEVLDMIPERYFELCDV